VKWDSAEPLWESARQFGTGPPPAGAKLVLEFSDRDEGVLEGGDDLLGTAELKVEQLRSTPTKVPISLSKKGRNCASTAARPYAIISRVDACAFPSRKTVYIIRHGESVWNKAQHDLNVVEMLSDTDHPLNEAGKAQAEMLQKSLLEGGPVVDEMLKADVILCSPLTRAVETFLIGLKPMFDAGMRSVILNPNLREKRNFGGKDSSGKWMGEQIPKGVRQALVELYGNEPTSVEPLLSVDLKIEQVMNKWWLGSKESDDAVRDRIEDMLHQLQFTSAQSIVLVGHSHFFRELLRQFRTEGCSYALNDGSKGDPAELKSKKLSNAGIAKLDIDFSDFSSVHKKVVKAVELLFSSELVD
jgi:broad specificity phosphatase PhoE